MKLQIIIPFALTTVMAAAQTTNQSQIRHIETAMNHLTVIEFGEPVTMLAAADPDSFQIERQGDKVLVKPIRKDVATNLFVWTASQQFTYELDPAGSLSAMDVLIHNGPPVSEKKPASANSAASEAETRKFASLVLIQTLMGAQEVVGDPKKNPQDGIQINVEQVYRVKERLYVRYSVSNDTAAPFRLTTPDVYAPEPTQQGVSLIGLRNHQLTRQMFEAFKAKPGVGVPVVDNESAERDLPPGEKTTGVVSFVTSTDGSPHLYQFSFGNDQDHPLTVEAVL